MKISKILVGGAVAITATVAFGGSVLAAVPNNGPGLSATTRVSDRSDSGAGVTVWAKDTFPRQITIVSHGNVSASFCAGNAPCQQYSYTIWDGAHGLSQGGWTAVGGLAPNQTAFPGSTLASGTFGSFAGTQQGTFYTDELSSPSGINVPSEFSGNGVSSTDWPAFFWPSGQSQLGQFFSLGADTFSYSYMSTIHHDTWVDSDTTADGGSVFAGNITR